VEPGRPCRGESGLVCDCLLPLVAGHVNGATLDMLPQAVGGFTYERNRSSFVA
jgi:hypothetical protein